MPKYKVRVWKIVRLNCDVTVDVPSRGTDDEARWQEMQAAEEKAREISDDIPDEDWEDSIIERYEDAEEYEEKQ